MTGSSSFDLTTEPWVPVLDVHGAVRDLSPVEVLAQADRLVAVVGELPTQGFALTRFLLAVLHRAVEGPADAAAWEELWRADGLPVDDVARYLETWRHRFDLLDPAVPFMQTAALTAASAGQAPWPLTKLIADVPNGAPLFTTRAGRALQRVDCAEAARWLVHAQAFDIAGQKTGVAGEPRKRMPNGNLNLGSTSWCGRLGGVLIEGPTLRDTLLLNLLPYRDASSSLQWGEPSGDAPAWERSPSQPGPELDSVGQPLGRPVGPAALYTWCSRRVRLVADDDGVTGLVLTYGDPLPPQDAFTFEPMSVWRKSEAQAKVLGRALVYMPREHSTDRAFWRGIAALLPHSTQSAQGAEAAQFRPPAVVEWLAYLEYEDLLPADYPIRLRAVGLVYGTNNSVVDELIDDELSLSVAVLRAAQPELGQEAVRAVTAAEHAVRALSQLAVNLSYAAGRLPKDSSARDAGRKAIEKVRGRAAELGYAALDTPFRRWLADLRSDSALRQIEQAWHRQVARIVRDLAGDLVDSAGAAAWKGREVNKRHLDAALADILFDNELRKAVPRAFAGPIPAEASVSAGQDRGAARD
jgi:CRISPR system Cascade subunit CasA